MRNEYKEKIASKIVARYADLEVRIIQDIVRRIKKTGCHDRTDVAFCEDCGI